MSVKGKGRVRKITRRQALAYNKTIPNRRGVTSLVELNGPGSYEQRYKRAQRILNSNSKGNKMAKGRKKKVMTKAQFVAKLKRKGRSLKQATGLYKGYSMMMSGKIKRKGKGRRSKKTRIHVTGPGKFRARANKYRKNLEYGAEGQLVSFDTPSVYRKKRGKGKKSTSRTRYIASRKRLGRSTKQAVNDWRLHKRGKHKTAAKKTHKKRGRPAKAFRRISLRVGGRTRKTYLYRTPKGRVRHLPEFALLGYKSQKARVKAAGKPGGSERISRRMEAIMRRRERAAAKAPRRIMAGRDIFSPNQGKVVSFEEWKKMNANKKRKKSKKGKKRGTVKQRAAWKRNIKKAQAAIRRKGRKGKGRKHVGKKARKHTSKKPWMKGLRAAHAARRAGKGKKRKSRKGRKHVVRKTRRSFRFSSGRKWTMRVSPARRGRGKRRGRRGMVSIHLRRNYRRNFGGTFVSDLLKVVKVGALVLSGYVLHRALTKALDTYGTAKITAVAANPYRGLMSSAVVALLGIPAAIYAGKKARVDVAPIVGGMAASLLHGALLAALNAAGQTGAVSYLSGYADRGGRSYRGMGEYYSFRPRQVFNGMGEYYEVLPQSGFGLDTAQLRQAAGSYPMEAVGFTQAPGGMGAAVTQAAGAAGEYIVYGAEGMGDYEEVIPTGNGVATNDGIRPNLHEAEQALNIVEAAGAMGDLPSQMNVDPTVAQRPVAGEPGGSRAGILAGGDGIFG